MCAGDLLAAGNGWPLCQSNVLAGHHLSIPFYLILAAHCKINGSDQPIPLYGCFVKETLDFLEFKPPSLM